MQQQCKNHPEVLAVDRCKGCAEPFCANCMVEIRSEKYCGSCKVMAIKGIPVVEQATFPCQLADEALKYSLIGIVCFGIILAPIALTKAANAKKMIAQDPSLTGSGKVLAATIIGWTVLVLSVIGLIARAYKVGHP
jgi:hypothetical protein